MPLGPDRTGFVVRTWKTEQGLPQNWVESIYQTRDGYLWVSTRAGLARFDGVWFQVFNNTTHPGMGLESVKALAEDVEGNFWIGTKSGLVRLREGKFRKFTVQDGLGHNEISKLLIDRAGRLWVGTGGGLSLWKGEVFQNFINQEVDHKHVYSLLETSDGGLRAGFLTGLFELDRTSGQFRRIWAPPPDVSLNGKPDPLTAIHQDLTGRIWIGTYRGGLYQLGTGGQAWIPAGAGEEREVRQIFEEGDGTVCILAENELYQFRNGQFEAAGLQELFPDEAFRCMTRDAEGSLWLGTAYFGLNRIQSRVLRVYTRKDGLSHNDVWSVSEGVEGDLWIGTSGGVCRWTVDGIESWKGMSTRGNPSVRSVIQDHLGGIWVGTAFVGAWHAQRAGENWSDWRVEEAGAQTRAMYEDRSGRIWIGTQNSLSCCWPQSVAYPTEGGELLVTHSERWLYRKEEVMRVFGQNDHWVRRNGLWQHHGTNVFYHAEGHRCRAQEMPSDVVAQQPWIRYLLQGQLSHYDVRSILEDRRGVLWYATGGGLNRLENGRFTTFSTVDGLISSNTWALHEDVDGYLWIGTDRGLARYKDGQFAQFTTREGLPQNLVNQILEDDFGYLWIGCRRGIYRVSRQSLDSIAAGSRTPADCLVLGESDGLLSSETNGQVQPSGCKSRDGRLWFPTNRGLVMIDPRAIRRNELPPPIWIEECRAEDKVVFPTRSAGTVRATQSSSTGRESAQTNAPPVNAPSAGIFHLPPGSGHFLEIRYTANSLWAPERVLFKYRLAGYDQAWVEAGNRRVAYYTNLKPGGYDFEVIACNNHGVWNERPAGLSFTIAPFFYQTWWFLGGSGLLCAAGVYGFVRRRLRDAMRRQQFEREKALAEERARIARDMHDDFGVRLTQISMLGNLLGQRKRADAELPEKISQLAQQAVKELDELVWALQPANDKLEELVPYLCAYAQELLAATDVRVCLNYPDLKGCGRVPSATRHHLFLIFKEALNNSIRYGRPSQISVTITVETKRLRLCLEDDGCGFDPKEANVGGNGLANMRSRMAALGGTFELASSPGKGTTITLLLPLEEN